MSKTLGQVAYEGWDSDVMTHVPWSAVPAGFQAAWQAAAEAVAAEVNAGVLRTVSVKNDRERKVIEAAKALVYTGGVSQACAEGAVDRLTQAVEALQEME